MNEPLQTLDEILVYWTSEDGNLDYDEAKAALTRREERIKAEAKIEELHLGPWKYDGNEFGDHYARRLNLLEQQLKTLEGNQ